MSAHTDLILRDAPPRDEREGLLLLTLRAQTFNEATRSVEASIATEDPIPGYAPRTYELVDEVLLMSGAQLDRTISLLDSHNRWSIGGVLGSIRNLRTEGDQLIGQLVFADDDFGTRAMRLVRDGHVREMSVGAERIEYVQIPAGQTNSVAGRSFTAKANRDLLVYTKWAPREGSLVVAGADKRTVIRSQPGHDGPQPSKEAVAVNPILRAYLVKCGMPETATDAEAHQFLGKLGGVERQTADQLLTRTVTPAPTPANPPLPAEPNPAPVQRAAEPVPPPQNPAPPAAADIARAERERITEIQRLAGDDVDGDLVQRAINEGWTIERASREMLSQVRDRRGNGAGAGAPAGHSRSRETDCTRDVLGAAIMLRQSMALDHQQFRNQFSQIALRRHDSTAWLARDVNDSERQRTMDLAHRYARLNTIDICREAIRLDGGRAVHGYDDIIRAAISGASLANVFTTSAYAQLLVSYGEAGDTTRGWVAESDNMNFQENERIRLKKKGGSMPKLPRGKTAEHATRDDTAEALKLARYAEQFIIDEQDLIDDRLNALRTMPQEMGLAASRLRPDLVYAILLLNPTMKAGTTLFVASRNLETSKALASATLKEAITLLSLRQENSVNLNLMGTHLITPSTLKWPSKQLLQSAETRNTTANSEFGTKNVLQDEGLTLISDARLENGVVDPDSGTLATGADNDWYLTDANFPAIEVAYRSGTGRSPQLRSFVLTQGQWGIGFDINMDIGSKAIRWESIQKMEG